MRRLAVLLLAVLLACSTGCNKFSKIKVNEVEIVKVTPHGLRGIDIDLGVEVDNPAPWLKISDVEVVVRYCGKVLGKVTVDPFILKARKVERYDIKARMSLDPSVSLYEVLMYLSKDFSQNGILDMTAKGSLKGGLSKTITEKDVPLKKLMEYAE
ncbi:MAG: LEA type 2 family protein [Bacteroidales bacterium]|nr:LEA type 2 family protein [Bacteroidales bacterium]